VLNPHSLHKICPLCSLHKEEADGSAGPAVRFCLMLPPKYSYPHTPIHSFLTFGGSWRKKEGERSNLLWRVWAFNICGAVQIQN